MSKRNISAQDKINAVKRYLNGLTSQRILANEFSISQAKEIAKEVLAKLK